MQTILPEVETLKKNDIAVLKAYRIKSNKIKGILLSTILIVLGQFRIN
jgi:hypothetical protein